MKKENLTIIEKNISRLSELSPILGETAEKMLENLTNTNAKPKDYRDFNADVVSSIRVLES